jgi:hypothetical protein
MPRALEMVLISGLETQIWPDSPVQQWPWQLAQAVDSKENGNPVFCCFMGVL